MRLKSLSFGRVDCWSVNDCLCSLFGECGCSRQRDEAAEEWKRIMKIVCSNRQGRIYKWQIDEDSTSVFFLFFFVGFEWVCEAKCLLFDWMTRMGITNQFDESIWLKFDREKECENRLWEIQTPNNLLRKAKIVFLELFQNGVKLSIKKSLNFSKWINWNREKNCVIWWHPLNNTSNKSSGQY